MMTTFKNIKRREGRFGGECSKALYDFIKKHDEYPRDMKGLMDICGLKCDFESVKVYQQFHAFLHRHREYTDEMFSILIIDKWFDNYKAEGITEEEIYHRFIDTCLSYFIIPLYYDSDGLYKLIDLQSFLDIKRERLISAVTEIKHKAEAYEDAEKALPDTIHSEMEKIQHSPDIKKLREARNELKKFLPVGEEGEK
jgi:hypothetical protein